MMPKKPFPDNLFVRTETVDDDTYYNGFESMVDAVDVGKVQEVAVYKLVTVQRAAGVITVHSEGIKKPAKQRRGRKVRRNG